MKLLVDLCVLILQMAANEEKNESIGRISSLTEEGCLHKVQSGCEALKLQLLEKERMVEIFQKQIDNVTQIVGQHSQTAGAVEVERSQLRKETSVWKLKAEELKVCKQCCIYISLWQ